MYRCISDRYDNDPDNTYDSVEDFRAMVLACFGESVRLSERHEGWYDGMGELVLIEVM